MQRQGGEKDGKVTGARVGVVRGEKGGWSAGTTSTGPAEELGSIEELIFFFLCQGHQKIPCFFGKGMLKICAR